MTKNQIKKQVKALVHLMNGNYSIDTGIQYAPNRSISVSNNINIEINSLIKDKAKEKYKMLLSRNYKVYFPNLTGNYIQDRTVWLSYYRNKLYGKFKVTKNGTDTIWIMRK